MNDPNTTTDGLLEDLESEYMAMAESDASIKVLDYAMAESVVFEACLIGNVAALLQMPKEDHTIGGRIRDRLLEVLAEHVAPLWAAREHEKRVAATQDMLAEWREEAA